MAGQHAAYKYDLTIVSRPEKKTHEIAVGKLLLQMV